MTETACAFDCSWLGAPTIFSGLARLTGIEAIASWPGALFSLVRDAVTMQDTEAREHVVYALASVIGAVLIPVALSLAFGVRRLSDVGLRRPVPELWPLLGIALLALTPIAIGLSLHPAFGTALDERLAGSPWFALSVIVGGCAEHFFFHGVLLAWLHPTLRFVQVDRPLRWPGRRTSTGKASVMGALRSLAIPREAVLPCLLSAPLFFAIHVGKPDGELWLSLIAGPVLAWLAFRTGGLVAPLVVHLSASLFAALIVLATRAVTG